MLIYARVIYKVKANFFRQKNPKRDFRKINHVVRIFIFMRNERKREFVSRIADRSNFQIILM